MRRRLRSSTKKRANCPPRSAHNPAMAGTATGSQWPAPTPTTEPAKSAARKPVKATTATTGDSSKPRPAQITAAEVAAATRADQGTSAVPVPPSELPTAAAWMCTPGTVSLSGADGPSACSPQANASVCVEDDDGHFRNRSVARGVEDGGRKWLGNRHRGCARENNAVAMLRKRCKQRVVIAGVDRGKTSCGIVEDDVESDGLRSSLEQPIE